MSAVSRLRREIGEEVGDRLGCLTVEPASVDVQQPGAELYGAGPEREPLGEHGHDLIVGSDG